MASLLWGKVYFKSNFAGYLREEPGGHMVFVYDDGYMAAGHAPISYTLPLQSKPHISHNGLHPFFDNLVAEGWLEKAQSRLLGKRNAKRKTYVTRHKWDAIIETWDDAKEENLERYK